MKGRSSYSHGIDPLLDHFDVEIRDNYQVFWRKTVRRDSAGLILIVVILCCILISTVIVHTSAASADPDAKLRSEPLAIGYLDNNSWYYLRLPDLARLADDLAPDDLAWFDCKLHLCKMITENNTFKITNKYPLLNTSTQSRKCVKQLLREGTQNLRSEKDFGFPATGRPGPITPPATGNNGFA